MLWFLYSTPPVMSLAVRLVIISRPGRLQQQNLSHRRAGDNRCSYVTNESNESKQSTATGHITSQPTHSNCNHWRYHLTLTVLRSDFIDTYGNTGTPTAIPPPDKLEALDIELYAPPSSNLIIASRPRYSNNHYKILITEWLLPCQVLIFH